MKETYAIISHDRHRDDYVYIVNCKKEDIRKYVAHIWKKDFAWSPQIMNDSFYGESSEDYSVQVAELKVIKEIIL